MTNTVRITPFSDMDLMCYAGCERFPGGELPVYIIGENPYDADNYQEENWAIIADAKGFCIEAMLPDGYVYTFELSGADNMTENCELPNRWTFAEMQEFFAAVNPAATLQQLLKLFQVSKNDIAAYKAAFQKSEQEKKEKEEKEREDFEKRMIQVECFSAALYDIIANLKDVAEGLQPGELEDYRVDGMENTFRIEYGGAYAVQINL